eukprot:8657094-Heterocapsa_arctica.AAC.1
MDCIRQATYVTTEACRAATYIASVRNKPPRASAKQRHTSPTNARERTSSRRDVHRCPFFTTICAAASRER